MKKIILILVLCISVSVFSQTTYMSEPAQFNEYQAPYDLNLINRVLAEKQRNYENSMKINCWNLIGNVLKNKIFDEYIEIENSSIFSSVSYFITKKNNYVIVSIKEDQNDYDDTNNRTYIYCGISNQRWETFKQYGNNKSWGESFHIYLKDFKCDCK